MQGDEKVSREHYRLKTYGGPQGRPLQPCIPNDPVSVTGAAPGCTLSTDRAIIQFDADAFYAQVSLTSFVNAYTACLYVYHDYFQQKAPVSSITMRTACTGRRKSQPTSQGCPAR